LGRIRDKAKIESEKINEIQFINNLEERNKRLTLDEKLSDLVERKKMLKEQ